MRPMDVKQREIAPQPGVRAHRACAFFGAVSLLLSLSTWSEIGSLGPFIEAAPVADPTARSSTLNCCPDVSPPGTMMLWYEPSGAATRTKSPPAIPCGVVTVSLTTTAILFSRLLFLFPRPARERARTQ